MSTRELYRSAFKGVMKDVQLLLPPKYSVSAMMIRPALTEKPSEQDAIWTIPPTAESFCSRYRIITGKAKKIKVNLVKRPREHSIPIQISINVVLEVVDDSVTA